VTTGGRERRLGERVLVTGAGGFIGSHVVEAALSADAGVRAFVRYNSRNDYGWLESLPAELMREVEIFRGDLANPEAVAGALAGCSTVLHLGALVPIPYSYRHPREFVTTNVVGTLNVLEAARRADVERIVHTSTSEVYGTPRAVPIDEDHPLQAQSPYAASKVGADQLALSYWRSFETPVVIARPFNTFGPRQSARAVVPTIITQALAGDRVELGATWPTRDFLFVDDTAAGVLRCAQVAGIEGEVLNLGTGVEASIDEVVARVAEIVERPLDVVGAPGRLRPPSSEVQRLVCDAGKAHAMLGWRPAVGLAEGLRRTVDWIEDSLSLYKPSIYNV
jgi:NAD dependent epimerase/dehydratase